jgi:hypothetical protein
MSGHFSFIGNFCEIGNICSDTSICRGSSESIVVGSEHGFFYEGVEYSGPSVLLDIVDCKITKELLDENFNGFGDWIKSIEGRGCLVHGFGLL